MNRKRKWAGLGLALLLGTAVAVSDAGLLAVTAAKNTGNVTEGGAASDYAGFTVDGAELVITENLNPNKYPQDFTETKVECKGKQYKGLKFKNADILLICLLNQRTGVAAYHIYNDADRSVYPFIQIKSGNDYIIAMPENMMEGAQVPSGYSETELEFEKGKAKAYQSKEDADAYLIYAMDSTGSKSWYEYDAKNENYRIYKEEIQEDDSEETQQSSNDAQQADKNTVDAKQYETLEKELQKTKSKYRMMIAVLIIAVAVLLILLVNTLLKGRRYFKEEYEEEEPDMDFYGADEREEQDEAFFREDDEPEDEWDDEERTEGGEIAPLPKQPDTPVKHTVSKKYESDIEIIDLNDL